MNKVSNIAAAVLLAIFFVLALSSSWNDAAIFDETAHIGAGYSYLTQRDMRLNPEHPPLVKDIAAIPLLFLRLNFPTNTNAWQNEVDTNQWNQGGPFLFEFGNNADRMLHAARFPIMLIGVLLGAFLYRWVRSIYGTKTALLALFFYCFSPTVLAHSRFVTTDIAAAFGFLAGISFFVRFLARPTSKRLVATGIVFGVAQLLKFSLFLLVPIYLILAAIWLLVIEENYVLEIPKRERWRAFFKRALGLYLRIGVIFAIGVAIIWTVYMWHVWNYPETREIADAHALVGKFKPQFFASLDFWLIEHPITRPLGQYLFGVMMVAQRTAGGNSAYFMGQVASKGWHSYFPTVYMLKEALGFLMLAALALCIAVWRIWKSHEKSWQALREWTSDNFAVFASIFFIIFYWTSSVANPLNIGIRHVLPTFPFIYFLVARELALWIGTPRFISSHSLISFFISVYRALIVPIPKIILVTLACVWIATSIFANFPYYLSYYNEFAGGTWNGYWYATDSNYDWGQDLKRLADFAHARPQEKIYLDYFGGSTAHNGAQKYWLKDQYVPWYSDFGPPPSGSIMAVSANSLMGSQATPVNGFPTPKPQSTYPWLRGLKPFARAGTSIFLYRIE
jgi:4-amino-4-deoxy-L-arabinose transferase-like glycosyltransferase